MTTEQFNGHPITYGRIFKNSKIRFQSAAVIIKNFFIGKETAIHENQRTTETATESANRSTDNKKTIYPVMENKSIESKYINHRYAKT